MKSRKHNDVGFVMKPVKNEIDERVKVQKPKTKIKRSQNPEYRAIEISLGQALTELFNDPEIKDLYRGQ